MVSRGKLGLNAGGQSAPRYHYDEGSRQVVRSGQDPLGKARLKGADGKAMSLEVLEDTT